MSDDGMSLVIRYYLRGVSGFSFFGILFNLVSKLNSLSLNDQYYMVMRNIFQAPIYKLTVHSGGKMGFAAIFVTIGTHPIFSEAKFGVFFPFFSVMVIFFSNQQIITAKSLISHFRA